MDQKRFFTQKNPRKFLRTGLLGYYWNVERVPFTKRSHFVLYPTSRERAREVFFKRIIKTKYQGKILPPLHPLNVRVQKTGQEIVEAARKGLRKEEECMLVKLFKKLGKRDYDQIPEFEWEFFVIDEPICNAGCHPGGKLVIFPGWLDIFDSDAEIAATIGHELGHGMARHTAERYSRLPAGNVKVVSLLEYYKETLE